MYSKIRDSASILLGVAFLTFGLLAYAGAIEFDTEKYSPAAPTGLGVFLIAAGIWQRARRKGQSGA